MKKNNILNDLEKNGYYLFKNELNTNQINKAKNCIKYNTKSGAFANSDDYVVDNVMDYIQMKQFIESDLLNKVNNILDWNTKYTKFRVSDNNNSVDASAFHKDIFSINSNQSKNKKLPEIFTILSYLDKTIMEIIPGSHKYMSMNIMLSLKMFSDSIKLVINSGDILIFYSTLLHRGIFTEGLANRRLIQVFDCFPNNDIYSEYNSKIYHVPSNTSEMSRNIIMNISKIKPIIEIYNFIGYINASLGYNMPKKIYDSDKYLYFSSEGGCGRIEIKPNTFQTLNKYYINYTVNDLPKEHYNDFKFNCYYTQSISIVLFIIIVIYLILYYIK